MILKGQLEEAIRIEENLKDQKKCLEIEIASHKEEGENREKILRNHIKERSNELNQLELQFVEEERRLEK
jgi:hypothetical protein